MGAPPTIVSATGHTRLASSRGHLGRHRLGATAAPEGLASIEKAESALNNIACLGYENGERVLWGAAQRRGKVWQQTAGTVADWLEWTEATWSKVEEESGDETNIVRDFLRPEKIDRPWNSVPIAAQWGEQAQYRQNSHQFVQFDGAETPIFVVDLHMEEAEPDSAMLISLESGTLRSTYRLRIDAALPGGYEHQHVTLKMSHRRSSRLDRE